MTKCSSTELICDGKLEELLKSGHLSVAVKPWLLLSSMLIIVGNAMGTLIVCGRINRAKVLAEASERCVFDQRAVIRCAENPELKAIAVRIAYYNFDRMTFVISKVNFHTVLQSSDC